MGVFIGLRPDPASAAEIARFAEVPAADLHLTLRFLGDRAALPPGSIPKLREQLADLARSERVLFALVGWTGRFLSEHVDVIYAGVEAPALDPLHERVSRAVLAAGVRGDDTFDFTPHITLGRVASGVAWPRPSPFLRVRFDALWLSLGRGERDRFPFSGRR